MGIRKIIHIDMDAFYASVEQRDDPQLCGKPVIVAWKGNRSVVCAASYEARAFGVRSAMPAVRAERLCPTAIFIAPDFTRYRTVSKSVRDIFKRHTGLIEPLSLDEAYLDVTENKTGLPTATLVARTVREQIRQEMNLTASAGVAPNKFLAKLASDWKKPDGLFVIQPEEVDAFLLPLPVGRLPGVGKVTEEKLAQLGIKRVDELRHLELSVLEQEFGRYGVRLYELARGLDETAVVPNRPTQSISVEDTFQEDVVLADTEPMIRRLAENLWAASRKEPRITRTVVLKLKTSEFKILTRSHTPSVPPSSCQELTAIALKLRERVDLGPRQRYRLVGSVKRKRLPVNQRYSSDCHSVGAAPGSCCAIMSSIPLAPCAYLSSRRSHPDPRSCRTIAPKHIHHKVLHLAPRKALSRFSGWQEP